MLAHQTIDTVTIGTVVATIQKLGWKKLDEAAHIKTVEVMSLSGLSPQLAALRDAALQRRAAERQAAAARGEKAAELSDQERRELRYRDYDKGAVLHAGIKALSATDPKQLSDAIDEIDEAPAEQLFRAILDLSLPALEPAAEEAARKNG